MQHNHITPLIDGQTNLPKPDHVEAPLPDVTDALLDVAYQAAAAGLVPTSLPDKLNISRALGMSAEVQTQLVDALASGPAADRALEAIAPAFDPSDVVQIKAIDPAGRGALSCCGNLSTPSGLATLTAFIQDHIGRRNLYFGANPRVSALDGTYQDAQSGDIAARRTAFVDMDMKDATDADPGWTRTRAELEALGPVLMVETGNGFHVHYSVEEVTGAALAASVGPLADAMSVLGSDNVADLPRVARLPWTVNLPTDNKRKRGAVPVLSRPMTLSATPSAARPVADLSAALVGVATRLALPGKKSGTGGNKKSGSARTGEKTGWPAPNLELLRMAMGEMPNDGPFDDRADWMELAHAVKGAAMGAGIEVEGKALWLDWCDKFDGDPDHDLKAWEGIKQPNCGWGTVMRMLERHNPKGAERVRLASAQAAFPPLPSKASLQPVQPFTAASLPPRRWLYGRVYSAGYVSMLVAPGGTGKSALTMVEAVAMTSGKVLLSGDKPHHPLRVWYHNAEDDLGEQRRRLQAAMDYHGVTHADLGGRLFLTSGRDTPLILARQGRDGIVENRDAVEWLVAELIDKKIEVLIVDPLGAIHHLPENSNEAANALMGLFREIAERAGIALGLVHHTGKMAARDMDAAGAGAARGASAFVDGARFVRQLRRAGSKDASLGIPASDLWRYVRVDNGKTNQSPAGEARWLRLANVPLNNGTPEYPDGDHVQTVEVWEPTGAKTLDTPANAWAVHQALSGADVAERRLDVKSPGWVGYLIADTLGLDVGTADLKPEALSPDQTLNRSEIKELIAAGVRGGWIVRAQEYIPDNKRKGTVFAAGEAPPEPTDETETDATED